MPKEERGEVQFSSSRLVSELLLNFVTTLSTIIFSASSSEGTSTLKSASLTDSHFEFILFESFAERVVKPGASTENCVPGSYSRQAVHHKINQNVGLALGTIIA